MRLSFLWRWDGTVTRLPYLMTGLLAFALKYNLDQLLAKQAFGREWPLSGYWYFPFSSETLPGTFQSNAGFIAAHLLLALPFIWLGIVLTIRRLRSIGWTPWHAVLFFVPFLNLLFFLLLSIMPSAAAQTRSEGRIPLLESFLPRSALGAAVVAIVLTSLLSVLLIWLATGFFDQYAWSLFVGVPFSLGFLSVLIYSYRSHRTFGQCVLVSSIPLPMTGAFLLSFALEGLICILMALPLAAPLAFLGGFLGFSVQKKGPTLAPVSQLIPLLLLAMPSAMWTEQNVLPDPHLFSVTTAVEINAPPATVWRSVISFDDIPEPEEWFFRLGIAYPVRARIEGRGPGAVRYCEFSTGTFVEPIEIWDEPRQLKFSVESNPAPMEEWTFYEEIAPPHLDGFFVSEGGQFLLEPLENGGTRLVGTTWYRHNMWPETYWRLWSDELIHRIHLRVLRFIKVQAESDLAQRETSPPVAAGTNHMTSPIVTGPAQ